MIPPCATIASTDRQPFEWWPQQASHDAAAVDFDAILLTIVCGAILLIVAGLIVTFSIRYRAGSKASREDRYARPQRVEAGWILGITVLALAIFAWTAHVFIDIRRQHAQAHTIYVVAQQWMWKFQHPGGRREINRLHLPADRPVRLIMTSQDVIHSFYVPAFRRKQDVLPDRFTSLDIEATRPGSYDAFCAEYCGHDHSQMVARVVVLSADAYERWLDGGDRPLAAAPARAGRDGPPTGEGAFFDLGCHACHFTDSGVAAPRLEGLFGREVLLSNDRTVVADEHYIRESILHPDAKVVAGYPSPSPMPTFQGRITAEQLIELIEYIRSLSAPQREGP